MPDRWTGTVAGLADQLTAAVRGREAEHAAEVRALQMVIALAPYANPELLPPFPPQRRQELRAAAEHAVRRLWRAIPRQRRPTA